MDIPDSLSLATPPYRSLLLAGPQGYITYPQRAAVCKFKLVALPLLGHVSHLLLVGKEMGEYLFLFCPNLIF